MNDKYSIATFTGVVVIALALGLLLGKIALAPRAPGPPETGQKMFAAGETKNARIRITDQANGLCKGESDGVTDAYPRLNPHAQNPPDEIRWIGATIDGKAAQIVVTFPDKNPETLGPGSPFQGGQRQFTTNQISPPVDPNAAPGDYPFESVTITPSGGTPFTCKNASDPGVHVTR